MVQDMKYKNKPSQETLYGWFPGGQEPPRHDPKDIYIKLGSRPPREQSYYEADILHQYQQSIAPSQRDYPCRQSVNDALKPPWSLHMQPVQNRIDNEEDAEKSNLNRSRSAPIHRIVLKIPLPNVSNNLFDPITASPEDRPVSLSTDTSESLNLKEDAKSNMTQRPKTAFNPPFSPAPSVTPDRFLLAQTNLTESRNTFNDTKQAKIVEKPVSRENSAVNNSTSQQSNAYANLMNDLLDSKYLENLNSKLKINAECNNPNNTDSLEATAIRLGLSKSSAAAIRRHFIHKVIEVKNVGKKPIIMDTSDQQANNLPIANKFRPSKSRPKTTNIQSKDETTNKSNKTVRQRAGTAPINMDSRTKTPPNQTLNENEHHYLLHDYHQELLMLSQDKKPNTGTTSQSNQPQKLIKPVIAQPVETEVLHTNLNSFDDVKLVEGHWKDQLLNRGNYLQKRPKYTVKLDPEKLKVDPPAPELHYNASETYFYNTLPFRKATFTINPNFISENLNIKKMGLQNRLGTSSNSNGFGPVKFRRDYAFVY